MSRELRALDRTCASSEIARRELLRGTASASFIAALSQVSAACCPCRQQSDKGWNNALNLGGVDPKYQLTPGSLAELVEVIRKAEGERARVRMTGSGHSFSDVAMSRDYMLSPLKLNRPLILDRDQLQAKFKDDPHLVRVEGGIRLRELNSWLLSRRLALVNLGGYDVQTIVGAATTGTHGSGIDYGPIASQIESIEIVTTGGTVLKVEPSAGITDRDKFPGYVETPEGRVPAKIDPNDELFNALAVSLGCMGVVYAVVLRVEPLYWLREIRELTDWGELSRTGGFIDRVISRKKLDPGSDADPDYYEIYFNPYPSKKGAPTASHRCLLTRRYKLHDEPTQLTGADRRRGRYGSHVILAAAEVSGYGSRLVEYMNGFPDKVPKVIDDSLASIEDKSYIDVGYNVFNLGPANLIRAYGIEMGVDVSQTVRLTERVFGIAKEFAERGWMHSSPPSLRFVRKSSAHLAMMYGRDTVMLEMGMLACAKGADDLLKGYETRLIGEFGARPHWGLDLDVLQDFAAVRALYPESADRWRAVYERMNAKGTFNANFTDRLGISV